MYRNRLPLMAVVLFALLAALWGGLLCLGWRWPLLFLGLKALAELAISLPGVALWAERMGLRVSYLHWSLLGFVTLGLLAAARDIWGTAAIRGARGLTVAILLLLASLIPLTNLWPAAWSGRWAPQAAAWGRCLWRWDERQPVLITSRRPLSLIAPKRRDCLFYSVSMVSKKALPWMVPT